VNKELEQNIQKMGVELNSIKALSAAYLQGTEAIQKAQEDAKIAPFKKQVTLARIPWRAHQREREDLRHLSTALAQADSKYQQIVNSTHQITLAERQLQAAQAIHSQERTRTSSSS